MSLLHMITPLKQKRNSLRSYPAQIKQILLKAHQIFCSSNKSYLYPIETSTQQIRNKKRKTISSICLKRLRTRDTLINAPIIVSFLGHKGEERN